MAGIDQRASDGTASARYPVAPARVRVRFADTDAAGIVYYGTYLTYFEVGRVEALRAVGWAYGALTEAGIHLPVSDAHVQYRSPARFDDLLLVHAWVEEVRPVRVTFGYELRRDGDERLIATGKTVLVCVDATTMRPMRLPPWAVEIMQQLRRTG